MQECKMKVQFKRAIAASIPLALLAGSTLAAGAANTSRQSVYWTLSVRPLATELGGGATLPIPAYLGRSAGGGYEGTGATSFGVAGSVFGYFASQVGGLNVEYCATGSSKGKGVIDEPANTVDMPCANAASATATLFGFLPPSGLPRQTYPTLAGSDVPLAQSDYSLYTTEHARPLEPVELPSLFGSIAIVYHDNALPFSARRLTLTDAKICGIYNGSIKTFGELLGTTNATAIHPVYRSDQSGTSFNFSNHLATLCSGFNGNQTFAIADPKLPATSIGAKGNGGIIAAVNAINGAVGYVETGYLRDLPAGTGPINYADVVNATTKTAVDPFAGLPDAAFTITASDLQTNVQIVQGRGPATTAPLTGVRSDSCVRVVAPKYYANPARGYPIIAVTYLLFNSVNTNAGSNGTVVADGLRLLERDLTTPSLFRGGSTPHITTVDKAGVATGTTGYSSLDSTFAPVLQATANACIIS
jgi:phosphate transport system substrate-binding protein